MNRRYCRILVVLAVLVAALGTAAGAKTWVKELAPGVTYIQIVRTSDEGIPRIINAVKVDQRVPGVEIRSVLAHDQVNDLDPTRGREDMGSIARRLKATAVVNTDFCNWTGDPLGLHIENGELVSEPYPRRTMFGITDDGKHLYDVLGWQAEVRLPNGDTHKIDGIDRDRGPGELIAYTRKWFPSTCTKENGSEAVIATKDVPVRLGVPIKGEVTRHRPDLGDTPIPADGIVLSGSGPAGDFIENVLREGMEVTVEFNVIPTGTTGWEKVVEAAGGTPRLLRNGEIVTDYAQEGIGLLHIITTHPRSAVGSTRDGRLVLATVDGRQSFATGMSLPDLARVMKQLGCVEALSLDGGGSSTCATWFGILNSPSDGKLRALPNGLAVFARESSFAAPEFRISAENRSVASGDTIQLTLVDAETGTPLRKPLANRAIWSTDKGIGFVDQSGRFTGYKTGDVEVVVRLGSKFARTVVRTVAGHAGRLTAALEADSSRDPNKSVLTVGAIDIGANGVGGVKMRISVTGGKPDAGEVVTGDDGKAQVGITWDGPEGGRVEVTSGDSRPATAIR